MKLEKGHLIVGFVIIALAFGAYMVSYDGVTEPPDGIILRVDGVEVKDQVPLLTIWGALTDDSWSEDYNAFVVSPGQEIEINVGVYNYFTALTTNTYKATAHIDGVPLWTSTEVTLAPNEGHEFFFTYTAPESGVVEIWFESFVKTPGATEYVTDDTDNFRIIVQSCRMVWWHDDNSVVCLEREVCSDSVYMYLGLKTFGTKEACDASLLGPTPTPTPTPTETPTPTPSPTPPPEPPEPDGWLIYGIGIVGVLAVLYFILRSKK